MVIKTMDCCFTGGRINSSYVWMYNSQLNLWIRVASLNKGRWRHKMSVLLGKVGEELMRVLELHNHCNVCKMSKFQSKHFFYVKWRPLRFGNDSSGNTDDTVLCTTN